MKTNVVVAIDDVHPEKDWGVEGDVQIEYLDSLNKKYGVKFNLFIPSNYHDKYPLTKEFIEFWKSKDYVELSKKSEICPILLIAPNSSQKRIQEISSMAGELVYCVAILGITGSSSADKDKLNFYMKNVSEYCNCPFVVGFGIKERSDIVEVNHIAHGAVVGSAIINELKKSDNPIETVRNYIDKLTK